MTQSESGIEDQDLNGFVIVIMLQRFMMVIIVKILKIVKDC